MILFSSADERHDDTRLAEVLQRFDFRGATLMVASSLMGFGRPSGSGVPDRLLDLLVEAVGDEGTLAIPAYTFSAYRGEVFDPETSRGLGSLAEAARKRPGFLRTVHPVYSHVVWGRQAAFLAGASMSTCFGTDSFFARFSEIAGARLVLFGGNLNMLTIWHLYDQQLGVPWRFVKRFTGRVRMPEGIREVEFDSCVRKSEESPDRSYCFDKIDLVARKTNLLQRESFASGSISSIREADLRRIYRAALEVDPEFFLFGSKEAVEAYYFKNELDAALGSAADARFARLCKELM